MENSGKIQENIEEPKAPNIGHNLAAIRRGRGYSQEYIATKLGVCQQTVSNIERSPIVDDDTLEKYAEILGVSVDYVKNYDLEIVIYNTQVINEGGKGGFEEYNDSSTTNSMDVIKFIVAENEKLHLKMLKEKEDIIKELKAEIRLLKVEIKQLRDNKNK